MLNFHVIYDSIMYLILFSQRRLLLWHAFLLCFLNGAIFGGFVLISIIRWNSIIYPCYKLNVWWWWCLHNVVFKNVCRPPATLIIMIFSHLFRKLHIEMPSGSVIALYQHTYNKTLVYVGNVLSVLLLFIEHENFCSRFGFGFALWRRDNKHFLL